MKVNVDSHLFHAVNTGKVKMGAPSHGSVAWASYTRIIDAMKASGEMRKDAIVSEVTVDQHGIAFTIDN